MPIESYYSNGSHYHQKDTDMISNDLTESEEMTSDLTWNPSPRPSYAGHRQPPAPPQRKHRWWAGTSSLLGSLKRRKRPKSRHNLGRIPHDNDQTPEAGAGDYYRQPGPQHQQNGADMGSNCDIYGSTSCSPGGPGPPEFYGSCYSTVGSEAGVAASGGSSLEAETQSRDSGKTILVIF